MFKKIKISIIDFFVDYCSEETKRKYFSENFKIYSETINEDLKKILKVLEKYKKKEFWLGKKKKLVLDEKNLESEENDGLELSESLRLKEVEGTSRVSEITKDIKHINNLMIAVKNIQHLKEKKPFLEPIYRAMQIIVESEINSNAKYIVLAELVLQPESLKNFQEFVQRCEEVKEIFKSAKYGAKKEALSNVKILSKKNVQKGKKKNNIKRYFISDEDKRKIEIIFSEFEFYKNLIYKESITGYDITQNIRKISNHIKQYFLLKIKDHLIESMLGESYFILALHNIDVMNQKIIEMNKEKMEVDNFVNVNLSEEVEKEESKDDNVEDGNEKKFDSNIGGIFLLEQVKKISEISIVYGKFLMNIFKLNEGELKKCYENIKNRNPLLLGALTCHYTKLYARFNTFDFKKQFFIVSSFYDTKHAMQDVKKFLNLLMERKEDVLIKINKEISTKQLLNQDFVDFWNKERVDFSVNIEDREYFLILTSNSIEKFFNDSALGTCYKIHSTATTGLMSYVFNPFQKFFLCKNKSNRDLMRMELSLLSKKADGSDFALLHDHPEHESNLSDHEEKMFVRKQREILIENVAKRFNLDLFCYIPEEIIEVLEYKKENDITIEFNLNDTRIDDENILQLKQLAKKFGVSRNLLPIEEDLIFYPKHAFYSEKKDLEVDEGFSNNFMKIYDAEDDDKRILHENLFYFLSLNDLENFKKIFSFEIVNLEQKNIQGFHLLEAALILEQKEFVCFLKEFYQKQGLIEKIHKTLLPTLKFLLNDEEKIVKKEKSKMLV